VYSARIHQKLKIAREPFLDRAIPNLPALFAGENAVDTLPFARSGLERGTVNQNFVRVYLR
jgi:hypothetical protein